MSKFHKLTIKQIVKETPNAISVSFDIPKDLKSEFQFIAGQYITVKKEISGKEIRRAYSICSEPSEDAFCIAIKAVENGTFSVFATKELKEGDVLEVAKPEGKFILKPEKSHKNNYLGIAAGSGITPIMAMLKTVLKHEPQSTFTLVYGNKTEKETIFKNEIENLANIFPHRFKVYYVLSREKIENAYVGRINKELLDEILQKNAKFTQAFLCGPEGMIETAKSTLLEAEISKNDISFELFFSPIEEKPQTNIKFEGTCEITVILDEEETTFSIDSKKTILTAALLEGIDAPYSCQGGICSSCMAKVKEGHAMMDKNTILSEEEILNGIILTCQAHPTTQKIIIDYDDV